MSSGRAPKHRSSSPLNHPRLNPLPDLVHRRLHRHQVPLRHPVGERLLLRAAVRHPFPLQGEREAQMQRAVRVLQDLVDDGAHLDAGGADELHLFLGVEEDLFGHRLAVEDDVAEEAVVEPAGDMAVAHRGHEGHRVLRLEHQAEPDMAAGERGLARGEAGVDRNAALDREHGGLLAVAARDHRTRAACLPAWGRSG